MRTRTTSIATLTAAVMLAGTLAGATSASAASKPGKPGKVTAHAAKTSYKLTWTKAAKHGAKITSYQVGDRTWSYGKKKWNTWKLTRVSAKKRAKTISAAAWSKHQGRVRARNAHGWGPWSQARTLTFGGTLKPPSGLDAATDIRQIDLSWWNPNPAGAGISSYRVYSRPAGTATWTMRTTKNEYMTYTGLTAGTAYQFYVTGTGSRGTTKASSIITATPKAPVGVTLTGWPTTQATLNFGDQPAITYTLGSSSDDSVPVVEEARQVLGTGSYGPWQIMDRKHLWPGTGTALLIVPGPGAWEVRLRTLATNDTTPTTTATRPVTMGNPTCVSSAYLTEYSPARTQCEISVRTGTPAAQKYVIEYPGNAALADQDPTSLGAYFHGDTNNPREFEQDTKTWAFGNGAIVIDPISPRNSVNIPLPAWGQTTSLDVALGLATGRDIRAFNAYFGTTEAFYWGHSGGSWFLSNAYIPTGAAFAPGPVALNCGANDPQPLDTQPNGDGTYGWEWTWNPNTDTATRAKLAIQYNYGDQDFLVPQITRSIAYYQTLNFPVSVHAWPGVDHCGKDFSPENMTWIAGHMNAF